MHRSSLSHGLTWPGAPGGIVSLSLPPTALSPSQSPGPFNLMIRWCESFMEHPPTWPIVWCHCIVSMYEICGSKVLCEGPESLPIPIPQSRAICLPWFSHNSTAGAPWASLVASLCCILCFLSPSHPASSSNPSLPANRTRHWNSHWHELQYNYQQELQAVILFGPWRLHAHWKGTVGTQRVYAMVRACRYRTLFVSMISY